MDRARLVTEAFPLVHRVASKVATRLPRSVELSDLTQAGFLGLLDAASRFDWDKGVRFSTYAELRIRGAILDSLRELDWVPRSLRRRRRELKVAERELESRLARRPHDEELASAMELTPAELRSVKEQVRRAEAATESAGSLEQMAPFLVDSKALDPEVLLERREVEHLLARAIEKLPPRERLVLTLYYHEELTMKEVGRILGVNESRVSQIHSQAVSKLRLRLRRQLRPSGVLARIA
ncbi:MAG: FliA/WhiG family RNA polymerase sigma factor [Vicinamibacteria bacterium]